MITGDQSIFVESLPVAFQDELAVLFAELRKKRVRNKLRRQYFDYKSGLKDLGIAIPPSMQSVDTVIGWSAKGIEGLTKRSVLDGFTAPDDVDAESIGVDHFSIYLMTHGQEATLEAYGKHVIPLLTGTAA